MKNRMCVCLLFLSFALRAEEKMTYLGVGTLGLSAEERAERKLPEGIGLKVDFLVPGAPAEEILEMEDVLTKLDDQWLVNPEQLAVLVRMRKPGDSVRLTLLRGGERVEKSVVLGERLREMVVDADPSPIDDPSLLLGDPFAQRLLLQQMIDARKLRREMQMQHDNAVEKGELAGAVSVRNVRRVQFMENGRSITFEQVDGKAKVTSLRNGVTEFEGEVNTPEERAKLPADVRKKLVEKGLIPEDPLRVP